MLDKITVVVAMLLAAMVVFAQGSQEKSLEKGYVLLKTSTYEIEIPDGWKVSPETLYGQRKAIPGEGGGELGMMTAPPSQQSWEQIYNTSLYFIMREGEGTASPYKLTKTKRGYEAATFEVTDKTGFSSRRYVLIKHASKGLLALSVTIPDKSFEKEWAKHFKRMVDSALFVGDLDD